MVCRCLSCSLRLVHASWEMMTTATPAANPMAGAMKRDEATGIEEATSSNVGVSRFGADSVTDT